MKPSRFKLHTILGIAAAVIAVHSLQAQVADLPQLPAAEPISKTFNLEKPVAVKDINRKKIFLKGMNEGRMILTFPNMPDASAEIPMDAKNVKLSLILPKNYNELNAKAVDGKYMPYYRGMKDTAGSLMRFLEFPEANSNFHNICLLYYEAAVKVAPLQQAVDLAMSMPLGELSLDFIQLTETLVYRTIDEGQYELTARLLGQLYNVADESDFAEIAFSIADKLRTAGQHELTSRIYGSLAQTTDEVLRQKCLLWACYSSAVSGDNETARELLDSIEELDRGDENFLTYCLARGRVGYAEDNTREGLRYLSRAMVLATIEATFKAELYYLLIVGYQETGDDTAAERLVREFKIFYPTSPWLEKYESENGA